MEKKIVYLDMDGVACNFFKGIGRVVHPDDDVPEIYEEGFYRNLEPMAGAIDAINKLVNAPHLDVYIASKPATGSKYCASEKYAWIEEHIPTLRKKIFLTCNKNLLAGHYLIDDHPKKWNKFNGTVIHFNPLKPLASWIRVLNELL